MAQLDHQSDDPQGNFIQANGLNFYYDASGAGEPLILLHGGTLSSQMWANHVPILAKHFQVIALDSRGHGKTDNSSEALTYSLMADDVAAFVRALSLDKPLICGFSDGGQIALEIGMRYPDLAQALILGAAFYKFSDSYLTWVNDFGFREPGIVNVDYFEQERAQMVSGLRRRHQSQDSDYWQTLLGQLSTLWLMPLDYTPADFSRIVVPTLILVGDRDPLVPVEQAVEMYRLIETAELAIGPDIDHAFPWKVELFSHLVLDFLRRHRKNAE